MVTIPEAFALAFQYHQTGRLADAEALYRQILAEQPNHADALHHLGVIAHQAGHHDLAIALIRDAIALAPSNAAAHSNLGEAYRMIGRMEEAIASFRRALQLKPETAEIHNNLALALAGRGQLDEAEVAYHGALEINPFYPDAWNNLGGTLTEQGKLDEAVSAFRRAIELRPGLAEAHNNLGNALKHQGLLDEAVTACLRAVELQPEHAGMHSNLVYMLHYHPAQDDSMIAQEQQRWNRQFSDPLKPFIRPHTNDRHPGRRLRVGYVSPLFWSNAITFFLAPLLEAHDHRSYEIYCYAGIKRRDAITERMRKSADVWREVRTLSHAQLAECVRDDGIDILVDLSMHTADNRLPAFARQPAPVQVSWLAYPGSTGIEAIDYRLTDAHIDPAGQEEHGPGGQAVRLPDCWCCYEPIEAFPLVGPLPAAQKKIVTFGSLNQFWKTHEGLLHCWARLLEAVPESQLLMICPEGQLRERVHGLFAAHGVVRERVELVAPCPWPDYVRLFERVDLALDPFPCTGMTTTCHALWMGVPVITRAGRQAVSRASLSLLHTIGLPEWVAQSEEDYIRIAAEWAADLPRLAELRGTLRSRMQASPLMDAPRFARNLEAAYRTMWQRWCAENQFGHV